MSQPTINPLPFPVMPITEDETVRYADRLWHIVKEYEGGEVGGRPYRVVLVVSVEEWLAGFHPALGQVGMVPRFLRIWDDGS